MKKAWSKWLSITKKIMHVQASIFLTIFYVIIIIPTGFLLSILSPKTLHKEDKSTSKKSYWLKKATFKQDLSFAKEQ